MKEILDTIKHLQKLVENHKDFEENETAKFQRTTYDIYQGKIKHSVWRILLDESKTQWCIRNGSGFQSIRKAPHDQVVTAPANLIYLLLAKTKGDKEVANIILNQIAEKKYNHAQDLIDEAKKQSPLPER